MAKRNKNKQYPNGGDGMFFYHKKTKHPAKQIAHDKKLGRIKDIHILQTIVVIT